VGFSDTMAGLGRGLLSGLESIAGQVLPQFIQAGTGFLVEKFFPGATASLPPGRSVVQFGGGDRSRAPFPGEQPFIPLPGRATQVLQPLPTRVPTRTPGLGELIPDIFRDVPFAQTFTDLVRSGNLPTLPDVFPRGFFQPTRERTLPGGTTTMPGFPSAKTEVGAGVLQIPSTAGFAGGCPSLFSAGGMSARPISMFMVPNPITGKPTFFKHAGRPILFSGDLRACKTVNRIAARARRVRGRR